MTRTTHLSKPLAVALLWILIGVGCKKREEPDPLCETQSCCWPMATTWLAASIDNFTIGQLNSAYPYEETPILTLRGKVYDREPYQGKPKPIGIVGLCYAEGKKIDAYLAEEKKRADYDPDQLYQIWGGVYLDNWNPDPFISDRRYALKITRISRRP